MPSSTAPFPGRARAGAVLLALLASWGCTPEARLGDPDLQVRVSYEPDPPAVGATAVAVDVSDVDWSPRNGAHVILTGLREGVQLVVDTARGQGAGRYIAEDFRFEVAGPWVLRVRVESPDGRWVEIEHPVEVAVPDA